MAILNIIFLILFVGGAIIGYRKGAITQLGSVVAIVAAILACRTAGPLAVSAVSSMIGADAPGASSTKVYIAQILGNGILFGLVWLGVWLIARFVKKSVYAVHIGVVDRIGGAVFLVLEWFMVVSLVLNLWKAIAPGSSVFTAGNKLFDFILGMAPALLGALKNVATNAIG